MYLRYMDNKLLKELLINVDEKDDAFVRILLQNQLTHLNNCISSTYSNINRKQKPFYMKLAKQVVLNTLPLRNIVGVQPMSMPVNLVYVMQYTATEERSIKLEILSKPVAATTRQLKAGFSFEAAQNAQMQHSAAMEETLISVLASEITFEIFNEVLHNLVKLSETTNGDKVVFPSPSGNNELMTLLIRINQQANSIAARTRRGAGRILVTTPTTVSLFQMMNKHGITFKSPETVSSSSMEGLTHMGDIVSGPDEDVLYTVFMSMAPALRRDDKDLILVLYKGSNGECDTGYIHAPYIPVLPGGLVIDPATFAPIFPLMIRNGKWHHDTPDVSQSAAYYRIIEVDTLGFLSQDPISEAA